MQRTENGVNHPFQVDVDVAVPEAKDPEALAGENSVSHPIMLGLRPVGMSRAVDLDHYATGKAYEIEIVAAEGRLPPEVKSLPAQRPEAEPEPSLLRR